MSIPGGGAQAGLLALLSRMEDFRLRIGSEGSATRGHEAVARGAKGATVSLP